MSKHTEFANRKFSEGYQEALGDIFAKLTLEGTEGVKQWLADNYPVTTEAGKSAARIKLQQHGAVLGETTPIDLGAVTR